jgi:hypothetical protein
MLKAVITVWEFLGKGFGSRAERGIAKRVSPKDPLAPRPVGPTSPARTFIIPGGNPRADADVMT